jgi:hypothetical protein
MGGSVRRIEIAAFSRIAGFQMLSLTPQDESFGSLLAVLRDEPAARNLRHLLSFWRCGLLTTEPVYAEPLISVSGDADSRPGVGLLRRLDPDAAALIDQNEPPPAQPDAARQFAALGYAVLPRLLPADAISQAAKYYDRLASAGLLLRGDTQSDRYQAHNDPVGRALLRRLHPVVQAAVGCPLKPSYCYAALYMGGSQLDSHTDRPQCAYTLSLLLEHRPTPADGRGPWPLHLTPVGQASSIALATEIGGGILFQGTSQPHFRERLADDQCCTTLMLHYVDADFVGELG